MVWALEMCLCVNGEAIPLQKMKVDIEDRFELLDGDKDSIEMVGLDLRSHGDIRWMARAFNMQNRTLVGLWRRSGFLNDIRDASAKIRQARVSMFAGASDIVVPVEVRGKTIFVGNKGGLHIFIKPSETLEFFKWFLEEVEKDIENNGDNKATEGERENIPDLPMKMDDLVEDARRELQAHSNCRSVAWCPSRFSIRVTKLNKGCKNFRLKNLRKTISKSLHDDGRESMKRLLAKAINEALEFLDHGDPQPNIAGEDHENL